MSTISTKAEFLRLSAEGRLGNAMPSWDSPGEAIADGHRSTVMIRSRVPNSPHMRPDVPIGRAGEVIDGLVAAGAKRSDLYLTHMTPGVCRRLNAEVWRGPGGLYIHYSTAQTHLREALDKHGRHAERTAARMILEWACDANSLADIEALLDRYPDAVLEITAYDREMGNIPGRRVIIWEVRNF